MKRTNGAIEGKRERISAAPQVLKDEQTLADAEHTLAETDQTLADTDQTSSDTDQTSADRDQVASHDDQVASDHDLAHGGDRFAHEKSRDSRQRSARKRQQSASARVNVAKQRDVSADQRDLGALARDQAADARDLALTQRDAAYDHVGPRAVTGADTVLRAADQRERAARDRVVAAENRVLAAQERRSAAGDREQAARDRLQARADRDAFATALVIAETGALTGVHTRAAGLAGLDSELDRCRRSNGQLVVCCIDVVGLKALDDSAGDELLKRVVTLIRAHLRSYDLIIRLGGDEFLCVMSSMTLPEARKRFSDVTALLAASLDAGAIRTGFSQLTPDETAANLIARADNELVNHRDQR